MARVSAPKYQCFQIFNIVTEMATMYTKMVGGNKLAIGTTFLNCNVDSPHIQRIWNGAKDP